MKNQISILIIIILAFSCKGLEYNRNSTELQILTKNYQNLDTLHWKAVYTEHFHTCLGLNGGIIELSKVNNKFAFAHIPFGNDSDYVIFRGKDENLIDLLIDFETKAKSPDISDRYQSADSTYNVKLYVNDELTEFSFSKRNYNGIEELISEIKKLEIKN